MTLAAHSIGAFMLILFLAACYLTMTDFDPERSSTPLDAWRQTVPFLSYLVLAWCLLFR